MIWLRLLKHRALLLGAAMGLLALGACLWSARMTCLSNRYDGTLFVLFVLGCVLLGAVWALCLSRLLLYRSVICWTYVPTRADIVSRALFVCGGALLMMDMVRHVRPPIGTFLAGPALVLYMWVTLGETFNKACAGRACDTVPLSASALSDLVAAGRAWGFSVCTEGE